MSEKRSITKRGGRPRTATPLRQRRDGMWVARVTFPDGRKVVELGTDERAARDRLAHTLRGLDNAPLDATSARTFGDVAQLWTSGELAKRYPDHVVAKRDWMNDRSRLGRHVLPHVGSVPIDAFTLDHAEAVMRAIPSKLSRSTRRQIAQAMGCVLTLAIYPLKLRPDNPIPSGWKPKAGSEKAKSYLYPAEERALLECTDVPAHFRFLYGFIAREGMRKSEAVKLRWRDVDTLNGIVTLDENKTKRPRAWALRSDVTALLAGLREHIKASDDDLVFTHPDGKAWFWKCSDGRLSYRVHASDLQAHLRAAGVKRAQLFEDNATRKPIRIHDLRGTFVTLALANGKSEAWVTDRTGHKSSAMVATYKQTARSAAEVNVGELAPFWVLRARVPKPLPKLLESQAPLQDSKSDALSNCATGACERP